MALIAHIADVHLGAAPYGMEERFNDIFESFEFVVESVEHERPDALVIAGDLFDKPRPENRVIRRAYRLLRRLSDKGIPVVAAHGEHDTPTQRDETLLVTFSDLLDRFYAPHITGVRSLDELASRMTVEVEGLRIHVTPFIKGAPSKRRSLTRAAFRAFAGGRRSLLLGHFSLESEFPNDQFTVSLGELPRVAYAALGHIHRHTVNLEADPPYAYPGVMDPLKIDEARLEQSRLLYVDLSGDSPTVDAVKIPVRPQRVVVVEIRSSLDLAAAVERVREAVEAESARAAGSGKPPLIHVVLRIPASAPKTVLLRRLSGGVEAPLRSRGVLVRFKLESVGGEGDGGRTSVGGRLDLVELAYRMYSRYGLSREDVVAIVRDLVDALAVEGDVEKAAAIIDELASRRDPRVWERIAGEAGRRGR